MAIAAYLVLGAAWPITVASSYSVELTMGVGDLVLLSGVPRRPPRRREFNFGHELAERAPISFIDGRQALTLKYVRLDVSVEIRLELPEKLIKRIEELSRKEDSTIEEKIAEVLYQHLEKDDPDLKAELHLKLCEKYLSEAEQLALKGDYVQASEKAWGAAAQIVKAVAAKRGVDLKSHGDLWRFVTKLREETGDAELGRLWHVANSLHTNFYEAWATPELVEDAINDVKTFVEKLKKLL